ncbi:MAG TPA: hypothetical protein VFZ31_07290 [Vicinamibacterales bacterium]
MSRRVALAAAVLTVAWLLAYGPTVPGGFIKDDFGWIYHSRIDSVSSLTSAFTTAQVFYRPMVQLSFGVTELMFGNDPVPYALTNLLLGLACAASIYQLARAIGLVPWAALAGTALWAFNFHGINMAIVWLSGRTSLLGTLFSTLAALAFVRNRTIAAALLAFAAFLSKEEVLALPLILMIWSLINKIDPRRTAGMWVALAAYFVLRLNSGAVDISNAPPYYRFVYDPVPVATNIFEYADRSMTLAGLVIFAAMIAFRTPPKLDRDARRLALMGTVWLVLGFAVTIWLPIRSSLYAVFPSVGVAIAGGAMLAATARAATPQRAWRLAIAAMLLPFLLLPVYWARNVRWTELRDLSNVTIKTIQDDHLSPHTLVVLEDDLSTRANFKNVFGALLPEAAALIFKNELSLWIEPPPPELQAQTRPAAAARTVTYRLVNGIVAAATPLAEQVPKVPEVPRVPKASF